MAFGFSLPKLPTQALAGDPTTGGPPALSMADRLMMFGAVLKGHPDLAMQIPMMAAARQQFQKQQAATADLATFASGKAIPQRPAAQVYVPPDTLDTSPDPSAATAPDADPLTSAVRSAAAGMTPRTPISVPPTVIPARDPSADAMGGPPTVRGALPFLSRLANAGGNTEQWTKMLQAAEPKSVVVNGRVLDEHDPGIYGGYYGEAPTKGAEPVYDGNGKQVGWHMADGAIQAIGAAANAEARGQRSAEAEFAGPTELAKQAAQAAYAGPIAFGSAAGKAAAENPNTLETHDLNGVPTTRTRQQWLSLAGGGGTGVPTAPGAPAAAPAAGGGAGASGAAAVAPGGKLDPQAFYRTFVLKHEGGLNPSDLNGAPTMYGFNQTANPDINVKTLTPDTAAQRFEQRYFGPSGAADLPAPLAAVHADTSFINPAKAKQILAASGGDPAKYMDLREAWLNHLVQTQPGAAKYADAWANRNADLRAFAGQLAGGGAPAAPAAGGGAATGLVTAIPTTPGFHGVNAADQKAVDTARDDAKQAEDVAQKAHQFQELNKKTFTGPLFSPVRVHIPLLGDVPINPASGLGSASQPAAQAMDNLSMQIATGLRAPGQRLTQAEIFQNLKTVPSRTVLPSHNDEMAASYDDRAKTKRDYANFISDWLTAHGSLNGADAAWAVKQGQGGGSPASAPAKAPAMKAQPMQQIRLKSGGVATVVPVG